ncbi:MAG: J domain-containing protein [Lachnospiraceae bacterium]|nr:J domain-containing protein [Lachnospiraceae bacterium]
MIENYAQACAVLGVQPGASQEQIKSAYRSLLKNLHPDAHPQQNERIREACILVNEAYDYLEHNPAGTQQGNAVYANTARVMGSPLGAFTPSAERTEKRRRFEEQYRKKQQSLKEKQKAEIKQRQSEMAQRRKEREILNEIRMIRLAQAISAAMAAGERK